MREVVDTKNSEKDCATFSIYFCIYLFRSLGYHSQRQRRPFR